jgi:chaperonin cofactor prefoldin
MGFSKIVRDCVVMCLEDSQEFKGWKLKMLKEQRKQLKKQVSEIGKQLYENAELIEKQGGRVEE